MNRLRKTIYASTPSESMKCKLPCQDALNESHTTEEWLTIEGLLAGNEFNVLKASFKNLKDVVVKFGRTELMLNEYNICHLAHEHKIPNFIKYLCIFSCNDDETKIKRQDFATRKYICNGPGETLGMIIMPFYSMGSLEKYRWNKNNFQVLQNVLQQICWSLLYAYEQFGFVHGDMHVGNVLLRSTKKQELQ